MEEIGIDAQLVEEIRKGNKYIEASLGTPRLLKIHEDDIVSIREDLYLDGEIVDSIPDALRVKVTEILYFETLLEMLNAVDHKGLVPSAKTVDEALVKYREMFTEADEDEYGVVAFYFEVVE